GLGSRLAPPAGLGVDLRPLTGEIQDAPDHARRFSLRRWWRTSGMAGKQGLLRRVRRRAESFADGAQAATALHDAVAAGLSSDGAGLAAERAPGPRLAVNPGTRRLPHSHRQAAPPV